MHKPNGILEKDVKDELEWDPLLDATRVIVKADDGRITLTGAVPTYDESLIAMEDAFSIKGVTEVADELMVGLTGEAIEDGVLADDCATAIDKDRRVPHGAVKVSVVDGWVTLQGDVRRHFQRRSAEHVVRHIPGVLGVTNDITLSSDPVPSDVADRINEAFKRNAIVDDSKITVSNRDHTVYLDGIVGSWWAMDEAVDTAWDAPGVTDVENRLTIVP